jgi:predicted TIM-barrel fold metal-dependent hydrolase
MWAQMQVKADQLAALRPLLEGSGARLLFDHAGRPEPAAGLGQPGFAALLALAETGRACVKLSGYAKYSALPHPHPDIEPYVRALLDAYTPKHLVWASDWPFLLAPARVDYGPLLTLFEKLVPDADARHTIGWETPKRLFGFGG